MTMHIIYIYIYIYIHRLSAHVRDGGPPLPVQFGRYDTGTAQNDHRGSLLLLHAIHAPSFFCAQEVPSPVSSVFLVV